MRGRLLWKEQWVYAAFLGLVVIFFFDIIFLGKVYLLRDAFADFFPKLSFARRAFRDLVVPLWNPLTGSGHPFFADPYTGAAYPPHLLFYILPMTLAHKVSLVLHMTLAGGGMIALTRLWGFGKGAALLTAVCFVFSTYLVAVMEFFNIFFPICWGPLIFFLGSVFYERAKARGAEEGVVRVVLSNWGLICLLTICFACNYLAGNPQYLIFVIAIVSAYYVAVFIRDRKLRSALTGFGCFLGAGGISLLLCMPQILLFLELLGESLRSTGIDPELDRASVAPLHFLSTIFPFLFGKTSWLEGYWARSVFEFWLGAFYVGLLPLLMLWFTFLGARRKRSLEGGSEGESEEDSEEDPEGESEGESEGPSTFFLCVFSLVMIIGGAVLASGQYLPVYQLLVDHIPGFDKVRWPSRFMLAWVYFIPVLAGLGMHVVVSEKGRGDPLPRGFWLIPAIGALLAISLWAGYATGGDMASRFKAFAGDKILYRDGVEIVATPEKLALFREDWFTAAIFMTLATMAIWFLLRARSATMVQAAQVAVVGVAFLNLVVVGRRVHPLSSEDIYSYEPGIWEQIENADPNNPHYRVYTKYGLNQFQLYGEKDPEIYKLAKTVSVGETWLHSNVQRAWRSSLALDRYNHYYHAIPTAPDERTFRQAIYLMNVRYSMTGPSWYELVARHPHVTPQLKTHPATLPRAYLVKSWQSVSDFQEGIPRMVGEEFDFRREILLEPGESQEIPSIADGPTESVRGEVRKIEYDWNRVDLEVETEEACMLVLVDSWFPGWKAFVDGVESPVFKANLLFRAVEIPAGAKKVVFKYQPARWRPGLALAALGVGVMGAGGVLSRRMRKGVTPETANLQPPISK